MQDKELPKKTKKRKVNFFQWWASLYGDGTTENFLKRKKITDSRSGHKPTPAHHRGLRGVGITRSSHEESKARRKMAARSRAINRRRG
jgi:hypothetical protein